MAMTGTRATNHSRQKRRKKSASLFKVYNFTAQGVFLFPEDHAVCPETHFQCPDQRYCLPVFVRCNGVYDCPGREDELGCRDAVCPGYYRCRGSAVCLHPDFVCDNFPQCQQQDDEQFCQLSCPVNCVCLGLSFKCSNSSNLPDTPRVLDLSHTFVKMHELLVLTMLVYLDLSSCQLTNIKNISFANLQTLFLRNNTIRAINTDDFVHVPNLRYLCLAQNPISNCFSGNDTSSVTLLSLRSLDLSSVHLPVLDVSVLSVFPNLQLLNLSNSGVNHMSASGNTSLSKLQNIDLHGCAMSTFPPDLFLKLDNLQQMFGETYKLCCPQVLPTGFNPSGCHSPVSEISSCKNLLHSDIYRLFLIVFAIFSLSGNVLSLILREVNRKAGKGFGYSVFVTQLCLSDGLMGVYLVIIGVADRLYQNTYLWQDTAWKNSVVCRTAGFLALLSTEMSAFIICLITLDRFLAIRFPFSQVRFQHGSACVACCLLWAVAAGTGAVPFFPVYAHWRFYSHTDICIPLPITRSSFAGHSFAFGVMIVLNMILFVAIAVGQTAIYYAIRTNTLSSTDTSRKQQDLNIARRLVTIAATDFVCWFPVGLLGLLASTGIAVPGEVNVAMATLVIPINSAMNPFLYTVNVILEKRRQVKEQHILSYIKSYS